MWNRFNQKLLPSKMLLHCDCGTSTWCVFIFQQNYLKAFDNVNSHLLLISLRVKMFVKEDKLSLELLILLRKLLLTIVIAAGRIQIISKLNEFIEGKLRVTLHCIVQFSIICLYCICDKRKDYNWQLSFALKVPFNIPFIMHFRDTSACTYR